MNDTKPNIKRTACRSVEYILLEKVRTPCDGFGEQDMKLQVSELFNDKLSNLRLNLSGMWRGVEW